MRVHLGPLQPTGPRTLLCRGGPEEWGEALLHHLHRGVGVDFVVLATVEEPDDVDDESGKDGHQRVHVSHPGNLPDDHRAAALAAPALPPAVRGYVFRAVQEDEYAAVARGRPAFGTQ
jgi:hypothetical protein